MKRWLAGVACLACLVSAVSDARGSGGTDLIGVYHDSLRNDPRLREAEATRLAALESKPQAVAQLLPQLTGNGLASRELDTGPTNTTEVVTVPGGSITESFPFDGRTTTTTYRYGLDLRQSLFRWENWVALKRADAQVAQAEADYQAARQDLMMRVTQRYFDVLAAQDVVDADAAALASVSQQLDQATTRYQVGLIAVTDVEEARAAHDSAAAALIDAKRQLASTQERLREITGTIYESLARPLEPFDLAPPEPTSEQRWVDIALAQNLTLISSRLAADIAQENVSAARGGHLPTLDLVASGYKANVTGSSVNLDGSPFGQTTLSQTQKSIGLQFSFPLFSGGAVSSQVRQAVYQHRAAKDRVERVTRETEHDARDAYLGLMAEISRVKALRQAVSSNETALAATQSGYEAGTRTAVDVVESRRLWIQARTDYSRSRYDYMMYGVKLQVAAGTLNESTLQRLNALLSKAGT